MRVKMAEHPPPAPTGSAVSPCPTTIQSSRTPRRWKFTQHHPTTPGPLRQYFSLYRGWSGVRWPWVIFQCRASYSLDGSRAWAYCTCSGCGWGLFGRFYCLSFLHLSPSLLETARYRLKYCLKGPLGVVRWCWVNFQCRGVLQFGL